MSAHPIVHIEIAANDPAAAGEFYRQLFGWEIQPVPELDYTLFNAEGGPGGGFARTSGEADSATGYSAGDVIAYVGTDDIEATLAKIESLGGRVLCGRTEIPGIGWFAFFADPTGNRVGLFTDKG